MTSFLLRARVFGRAMTLPKWTEHQSTRTPNAAKQQQQQERHTTLPPTTSIIITTTRTLLSVLLR